MTKSPAFQFYVQDFLVGVRHFTAEEVGAYILLLCEQWDTGYVENNSAFLKKITKISPKKLENVLKKFEAHENKLINLRLEKERGKQTQYRDKQRDNINKRWKKESGLVDTVVLPPNIPNAYSSSSTSSSTSVIEAYASVETVVSPDDKKLKSEYSKIEKSIASISAFVKNKKPQFAEPYMDCWNLFAAKYSLAQVSKLTDERKKKLKLRLASPDFDILKILNKAKDSDILRSGKWFSFDWLITNNSNYLKVLEGNYDNKAPVGNTEPVADYEKQRKELEDRTKQLASE